MPVAVANARQSVAAPVRKARRFGLLSSVDVVDGGEAHWMLGGLLADGESCSEPDTVAIGCGPSGAKTSRSWYTEQHGDPWLAYMYETCKPVGRYSESQAKLKARFLASEQSSAEAGFQDNVLDLTATTVGTGAYSTVGLAVAALETKAAMTYGGQITLYLPYAAAAEASQNGYIQQVGDHLETLGGNIVTVGNYHPDHSGGTVLAPVMYATGAVTLYRGPLVESGPAVDLVGLKNDYYVLVERAYAALVDCLVLKATGTLCGCGGIATTGTVDDQGGGGNDVTVLDEGSSMSATALGVTCADSNAETAAKLNSAGVVANPTRDWGAGDCASVDCGGDVDREVRWTGTTWVGC
jgi:hypothetical protein